MICKTTMCTDKKTQQGSIVFPFQKVLNILVLPFMCGKNKFIESRERFVYPVNEPDSLHIYQKCSAERKQQVEFRLCWWCQIWRSYWCISKHFWRSLIRLFGLDDLEYLLNIWLLSTATPVPITVLSTGVCWKTYHSPWEHWNDRSTWMTP